MENQKIEMLLTEIRDLQRQHFEEYRRIAGESVAAQKAAIEQQAIAVQAQLRHAKFYRIAVLISVPLVAYLLWFLFKHS